MSVKEWIFKRYALKLTKQMVQILVSWVMGHSLERFGILIDPVALSAGIWTGLETLRSVAKHKYGIEWL